MAPRALSVALVALAFFLPLLEGPAELACVIVLLILLAEALLRRGPAGASAERSLVARRARPSSVARSAGLLLFAWALVGYSGVLAALIKGQHLSSEDSTRPLLTLGYLVGVWIARRAEPELLIRLGLAFGCGAILSAGYGLLQVGFGALPIDHWLLKNPRSPQIWVPGQVGSLRAASGLFYNRLKLAHTGVVALGLLMTSAGSAWNARGEVGRRSWAILVGAGGFVLLSAVALSQARMALIALGVSLFVSALGRGRVGHAFLALVVVPFLGLGVFFLLPEGRARLGEIGSDIAIRLHIFQSALGVFRDHLWLGAGHGFYRRIVGATWDGIGMDIDAHNLILNALAETGLIGTVALVSAIVLAFVNVTRTMKCDRSVSARSVARAPHGEQARVLLSRFTLAGLSALLTLGLTHVFTHHASVALLFNILLGLAAGARPATDAPRGRGSNPSAAN